MAVALWSRGLVALWPHLALVLASARPRAWLGLARLLWSAGRTHTALVVRRSHAHGSSGQHVLRMHGSIGPQVARA